MSPENDRAGGGRHRRGGGGRRLLLITLGVVLLAVTSVGVQRWRSTSEAGEVDLSWSSWALLDRRALQIRGSANLAEPNQTESMVKAWIAADNLRRLTERNSQPADIELGALNIMIVDSYDETAQQFYERNGGDAVIERMISICGLTETTVHPLWWSKTRMSARDAVRMGACLADGRAAGPAWTKWLLDSMTKVRGQGRFGIISALPEAAQSGLSIKNGWTYHVNEGEWVVNCLAISADWVMAVETRYPVSLGDLDYGAGVCAETARKVLSTSSTSLTLGVRSAG